MENTLVLNVQPKTRKSIIGTKKPQVRWKTNHEARIRELYPKNTTTRIAMILKREFGLNVTQGAVANKVWEMKLRKRRSNAPKDTPEAPNPTPSGI